MIWVGFACLALTAVVLGVVRVLPGEVAWEGYAGQGAFVAILGGVSSGGIVIASLLAYWAGEFSNSYTLAKLKVATGGRMLWLRTIGSTIIGEGVDTLVFTLAATLAGVFPWEIFVSLALTNYLFKVGIEAVFTPLTYLVTSLLKKAEKVDVYSDLSDLNPLAF